MFMLSLYTEIPVKRLDHLKATWGITLISICRVVKERFFLGKTQIHLKSYLLVLQHQLGESGAVYLEIHGVLKN